MRREDRGNDDGRVLGAGAAMDARVADAFGMTGNLVSRVAAWSTRDCACALPPSLVGTRAVDPTDALSRGNRAKVAGALNYVCSALRLAEGLHGRDPFASLDVERVFAAGALLA